MLYSQGSWYAFKNIKDQLSKLILTVHSIFFVPHSNFLKKITFVNIGSDNGLLLEEHDSKDKEI